MKIRLLLVIWLSSFINQNLHAQGCSDPGMCTIGTLYSSTSSDTVSGTDYTKAEMEELLNVLVSSEKYNFSTEAGVGFGDGRTSIYSLNLRLAFRLKNKTTLGVKLPFINTAGTLGQVYGLGDLTINFQNIFKSGDYLRMAYTLGVVIPTNTGNAKYMGAPLPMVYQTSMGLFGTFVGLTTTTRKWNFALGAQQNFGRNKNEFITDSLVIDPSSPKYDPLNEQRKKFASSRNINNGPDIMLRVERTFAYKSFKGALGILPIYRITNSTIKLMDESTFEVRNSSGLTLNITGGISYMFNKKWRLSANAGAPIINRQTAPDGLRRMMVYLLRIERIFW